MVYRTCSVDGCDRPHNARGLCSLHYRLVVKYGSIEPPPKSATDFHSALLSAVEKGKDDDCWEWLGKLSHNGYGIIYIGGHTHQAHRLAYRLFVGAIPDGWHVHHKCGRRGCVNPGHLEALSPGTHLHSHRTQPPICSVSDCGRPTSAKGLCSHHYNQARKLQLT